nr:MAG TPA: hypothetical protein [Caudoviricetes sp.]
MCCSSIWKKLSESKGKSILMTPKETKASCQF